MNSGEIQNVVAYIKETCKCLECKSEYEINDIEVIATTKKEGLFESKCSKCDCTTITSITMAPEVEIKKEKIKEKMISRREHKKISRNDILDMKNFLNRFDGDFKKIFINKK